MFIPVFEPKLSKLDKKYANKALEENAISGFFGDFISKFENNFAKFIGTKYALTVSSGTTALHLAVATLGLKKNDEVLIASITNMATFFSVMYQGIKPIPIDVNSHDLNINIDDLEKKITKKTKAIIVVHLFGKPVNMKEILRIKKKYNLYLIEDCAEAHGAEYFNKKVGSFGDIGCFSFYANKIITTGEGGMITTNKKDYFLKAKNLKELSLGSLNKFMHNDIGYNYRLTNIQSAIGYSQLKRIKKIISKKILIAKNYNKLVDDKFFIKPTKEKNTVNVYWMYHLILKEEYMTHRNKILKVMLKKGIQLREGFVSATLQESFKINKLLKKSNCKVAEKNSYNSFYLPSSLNLTLQKQNFIAKTLNDVLGSF